MTNLRHGNQYGTFFIVRVATTTNITLANLQTVDSVVLVAGDLVLVKNQIDQKFNGVYQVVDGGNWVRAKNFNTSPKLYPGLFLSVMEGDDNKITYWKLLSDRPIVIGVDDIIFDRFDSTGEAVHVAAGTQTASSGTVVFSNSNGLTFGMSNNSVITGSYTVPTQTVQTQNLIQAIYDGTNSITTGTIRLSNSNGISFGINGQTLTASHNGITSQTAQTQNVVVPSAGTQTATSGTVVFSNSNGISFGMSGSSQITASYTVPSTVGLISAINVSGGTTSNNLSAITFSNSNGVSFGLDGSVITASVSAVPSALNVSAGTTSNFVSAITFSNANNVSFGLDGSTITALATFPAQTNQTVGLYATGNTTQNSSTTLDARSLTFNGIGGLSIGYSNGSIQLSAQTTNGLISAVNVSAGTTSNNLNAITFSNFNGLSFGLDGSTITGSYTVPTQSNQTQGYYAVGNTIGQSSSTTIDARSITFSGSGVASVGYSSGSIIINVPAAEASINFSGGTTSNNLNAITFSNSNGVSFGLNAGTLTASVASQTNQTVGLYAVSNTTGQSSSSTFDARSLSFHGAGIASVGYSNGSVVVSVPSDVGDGGNIIAAGTQTADSTGTIIFSNSNNISFGMSNSSIITASYSQSDQTIGLYVIGGNSIGLENFKTFDAKSFSISGKGAISVGWPDADQVLNLEMYHAGANKIAVQGSTASTQTGFNELVVFSNSNNITFGMSTNNRITASYRFNVSGGTTSNNLNAITFSNLNNVSFGLDGSTITASVPSQTVQTSNIVVPSAGTQTATSGTVVYSNSNNISFGMSGSSRITASYNFNVSAGTTSNNLNSLSFSNGSGVSFGLNAGTLTGSIAAGATATGNFGGISAGTQVATSGTVVYSNSNNITFGLSGSSRITASYNFNVSAGTTSNNLNSLSFGNGSGVSFGLNAGTLTASVSQSVQTQSLIQAIYDGANSITTGTIRFTNANGVSFSINGQIISGSVAAQTNQTVGLFATGNTTQNSSTTLDARGLTFNGLGAASVGYSNGSIQISVPNASTNINVSAGTTSNNLTALTFSNSNNISFGLDGSTITASASYSQSTAPSAIVAGTQTATSGSIIFSNSNGISFGMSGSSRITASYTVPSTVGLISAINISAGTASNNLSALIFSNFNGLSFGLDGSTITGSYTVPTQTNQTIGGYAVGNTAGQSSSSTIDARSLSFSGAGIASVGYSGGSVVISVPSAGASINFSAGTTSNNLNAIAFSNSNNVSFGIDGSTITGSIPNQTYSFVNSNGVSFGIAGSVITASVSQTNQTVGFYAVSNTTGQSSSSTIDARSLSFHGAGIASVGYSGGSVVISVPSGGGGSINISAGTASNNLTALTFSNSNGVSFGLNGSVITASAAGGGGGSINISAGTTSNNLTNFILSNSNNVSFGIDGSTITGSIPNQTYSFVNSNGVSFGIAGSSITASVLPVGKASNLIHPPNPWITNFAISNAILSLQHFNVPLNITASQANLLMSLTGNTNSSGALTISLGIYTMSASTMSLVFSNSRAITWTSGSATSASSVYGGVSGARYRTISLDNWSISAGDYILGMWFRTTNNGTWRAYGQQGPSIVGAVDVNETNHYHNGVSASTFTTGFIGSINLINPDYVRTGANALQQPGIIYIGSV